MPSECCSTELCGCLLPTEWLEWLRFLCCAVMISVFAWSIQAVFRLVLLLHSWWHPWGGPWKLRLSRGGTYTHRQTDTHTHSCMYSKCTDTTWANRQTCKDCTCKYTARQFRYACSQMCITHTQSCSWLSFSLCTLLLCHACTHTTSAHTALCQWF